MVPLSATEPLKGSEMTTEAPAGYALPKLAADLIEHAVVNGWKTAAEWHSNGGETFVHVRVARMLITGEEPVDPADPYATVRGDRWRYGLTWHSREAKPGQLKLFRGTLAQTPWHPQWADGPSVKGIRWVISRHPG